MSHPPLEPEECVGIMWSLTYFFSKDPQEKNIAIQKFSELHDLVNKTTNSIDKEYLQKIINEIYSTLRVLDHRKTGMNFYVESTSNIGNKKISDLQNLSTINFSISSLLPRGLSIAGGVSISDLFKKVLDEIIPSFGNITGYELAIFGGIIGYAGIEVGLRIIQMYKIPKTMHDMQFQRHTFWNRYVRESRAALTNLLITAIRLHETYYPDKKTYKDFLMYQNSNEIPITIRQEFVKVLDAVVTSRGPQIGNDIFLRPKNIFQNWKSSSIVISVTKGDQIKGTFNSPLQKPVDMRIYFTENNNVKLSKLSPIQEKKQSIGDEFHFVTSCDGTVILLFSNLHFSSSYVTCNYEIIPENFIYFNNSI